MSAMRIALIHDWLIHRGGAERVLLRLHSLWPSAPIYTLAARPDFVRTWLPDAYIRTSSIGGIPYSWRFLPSFSPFMPSAIESFDVSAFDVVISSSVLFSKGIITRTRTHHISYCYSPSRMLWDRNAAYERSGLFSRIFRHGLRLWDYQAAQRPDTVVSISKEVQHRVQKYYGRKSQIIYPPIEIDKTLSTTPGNYYLAVGRLMPHKNFGMVLDALVRMKRPLIIAGAGPLERALRSRAGNRVIFKTNADDAAVARLYANCRAVIVPNDEDFGMTAVEGMGYGKPVLALRAGGALDTVSEGITGEFFDEPIPEALADGILRMERSTYDPAIIRRSAEPFLAQRFDEQVTDLVAHVHP